MRYTLELNYSGVEDGYCDHSTDGYNTNGQRMLDVIQAEVMERDLFHAKQIVLREHDDEGGARVLIAAVVPTAIEHAPVSMLAFGKLVTINQVEG